jgi:hypothetical protein
MPIAGAVTSKTMTRKKPLICAPTCRRRAGGSVAKSLWGGALLVASLLCVSLAATDGVARAATSRHAIVLAQAAPAMSADEAAALVRQSSGGRILGVRRVDTARGPAYHIKVLLDGGRVRVFVVDAGKGQILR